VNRIVIVGNGIAGNTAAEVILRNAKGSHLTLISEEPFPEYSACLLPDYLSGRLKRERVFLKRLEDYQSKGIESFLGEAATEIDLRKFEIRTLRRKIPYDKLILSTGTQSIISDLPGVGLKGVFPLKTLGDIDRILGWEGQKAVVLGAGLVGLKASIALKRRGWDTTLISRRWVLPRVFDEMPAQYLERILVENGIQVVTGAEVKGLEGRDRVERVVVNHQHFQCDMVILALGLFPNTGLAKDAGIKIGQLGGIKTDDRMMTNIEEIYGCGDCVEQKDRISGYNVQSLLWHNAKQQGEIAGFNASGVKKRYPGVYWIVHLNLLGTSAVAIGLGSDPIRRFGIDKEAMSVIDQEIDGIYERLILIKDQIVGIQMINSKKYVGMMFSCIQRRDQLSRLIEVLRNRDLLRVRFWMNWVKPYLPV